ncbi:MAG: efflux RND transporter periplasmic adaptor subunit [Gammaproteobacteria bacterium]
MKTLLNILLLLVVLVAGGRAMLTLLAQPAPTSTATHDDHGAARAEDRHEGESRHHADRTRIPTAVAAAAGIETARVAPARIETTIAVQGRVRLDPARVRKVRARYPGLIRQAQVAVGEHVRAGQVLVTVESDESLRTYEVLAPIDGIVLAQHAGPGEVAGVAPVYTVAALDRLWIDFALFPRNHERVAPGQAVRYAGLGGAPRASGRIDWLAPTADPHSQAVTARTYLDQPRSAWHAGLAVSGEIVLASTEVTHAVRTSALQRWRGHDVVFVRAGEVYAARPLTLGRRDARHAEVLAGLDADAEYVVANSYLVKADIEKSGASHAH